MNLRCPSCMGAMRWANGADTVSCAGGHHFGVEDEVLRLLTPQRRAQLDAFGADVRRYRDAEGLSAQTLDFERLPASAIADPQWRERADDLAFVRRVARGIQRARAAGSDAATAAQRTTLTGLDIGAFNGWLSHNLLCDGVDITAVDLFDDDDFGLGARRHFHRRWRAVQADVCTPELFAGDFDLVVMNHGVHFLPDPTALLARWQHRVAPGGAMVVLGLRIYRDGRARRDEVDAIARRGSASGATLFPLAGPGLLDVDDARTLRRLGFALRPTAARWKGNLRAILQLSPMLRSTAPVHLRAVYRRPG